MADNKRVILITGDKSKWYEQAIFIVRRDCMQREMPKDFISEAEQIVGGYLTGEPMDVVYSPAKVVKSPQHSASAMPKTELPAATKKLDRALNVAMLVCVLTLAVLLLYAYFA